MAEDATLEYTPTWVVAAVCTVIIAISLTVERILHYLGKFLKHEGQNALFSALQKIKEELMLLGFISLLLTVSQGLISNICVPKMVSSRMLPCKVDTNNPSNEGGHESCPKEGQVPLLSLEALHQLHIFIFVLAVVHVVFCATTMVLGGAKIRRWKHWETAIKNEIENSSIVGTNLMHPDQHRMFIKDRAGIGNFWRRAAVVSWMIAFMKQFHPSVSKSDYRALRAGFIMKHCSTNPKFNFHKYMMKTLEDDFKKVVGISWYLWLFVVIFLLLNVDGWHTYFWLSFLPLIILLTVGAKLEHIITKIAQDAAEGKEEVPTSQRVRVRPSDDHFWFGKPVIVLYLIHFILFQNSFEIAFFFWIWTTYGFDSCIMESIQYLIPRLVMGVLIQVLCSYSTLPLYALVTQMGDLFKEAIFEESIASTLHDWAEGTREKTKKRSQSSYLTVQRNSDLSFCSEAELARMESACRGVVRI